MKKLKVTLKRSIIGTTERQQATVRGLGLRKVADERLLENTPAVRGMVKRVIHLVDVSEIDVDI
jgi:large subunit ribosomal protein L30